MGGGVGVWSSGHARLKHMFFFFFYHCKWRDVVAKDPPQINNAWAANASQYIFHNSEEWVCERADRGKKTLVSTLFLHWAGGYSVFWQCTVPPLLTRLQALSSNKLHTGCQAESLSALCHIKLCSCTRMRDRHEERKRDSDRVGKRGRSERGEEEW